MIYIFPVLINYILGGVFFITAYRFSQAGVGEFVVTATMAVWSLIYCAMSFVMGRLTTVKNASRLIIVAAMGLSAASLCFIIFPGLYLQFLWIALMGVFGAIYCIPFQVFMKSVEPDASSGVVRSTSLYTFAWSIGLATGPFIFGLFSWQTGFIINAVMGLLIAVGVWLTGRLHRASSASVPDSPERKECHLESFDVAVSPVNAESVKPETDYSGLPDYAWLGWIVAGVGCVTIAHIRTLVPCKMDSLHIEKDTIGFVIALVSYTQGLVALCLIRSKYWMYKPLPAVLIGLAGAVGLFIVAFCESAAAFYFAALFYGVYSGCFFFYFVFHSLVHPTKSSRYVSINEIVVGLTTIAGPLAGGYLAQKTSVSFPFLICGIMACAAGIFQACVFFSRNPVSK